jgi:hypothetical protein
MRRLFLLVLSLGAIIFVVLLLALGAFPPEARPRQIEKVLPNDRFQRSTPPPAPPIPPATSPAGG